ncbi:hypothetical protein NJB1604_02090 [Mycobacterium marinum]|uniref:RloB family protein n=1 Tax=Mycobacterium marinum TaxID=1781 RepID=UPI0021C260E9|nr:RloB family protein [Mycobacterium marinum]GJO37392.1 hypothetical protein NJB1604_02090 [Mycobacterium marinum]
MRRPPRSGNSRRIRPATVNNPKKLQIRAYLEGETEEIYLVHWNREYRDVVVDIYPQFGLTPLNLVEQAIKDRTADLRAAKKRRGPAYDEYWCVFDVDQHSGLMDALTLAAHNDIKAALSNPCLELWFLLHHQRQTAYIDRKAVQKLAYAKMGCRKNRMNESVLDVLVGNHDEAMRLAQALDQWHAGNDTKPPDNNPSTNVWELTQTIRQAASLPNTGAPLDQSREQ